MFDRCTETNIHYVAVFTTYWKDSDYNEALIVCSPLIEEKDFSAKQRFPFFYETLANDNDKSNVSFLIEDSCLGTHKISSVISIPLIGCFCHKFNLAVEKWILEESVLPDALQTVHNLIPSLRTLNNTARLREVTNLETVLPKEIRWFAEFKMFKG